MKTLQTIAFMLFAFSGFAHAKIMVIEGVLTKHGENYVVASKLSSEPISIKAFVEHLKKVQNGSTIGLKLISAETVPITHIQEILDGASKNPLIEIFDIRLGIEGRAELERREKQEAQPAGTGQPATRPVDKPEGGDKPQPEAEGRRP